MDIGMSLRRWKKVCALGLGLYATLGAASAAMGGETVVTGARIYPAPGVAPPPNPQLPPGGTITAATAAQRRRV